MKAPQTIHGMTLVEFEVMVAQKYTNKVDSSKKRGIEFSLSFAEFRRLLLKKRCSYTGIEMTIHRGQNAPANTDLTIERVDNKVGYVRGNVISVCAAANKIKSVFEDPNTLLNVRDAVRMFSTIDRIQKGF